MSTRRIVVFLAVLAVLASTTARSRAADGTDSTKRHSYQVTVKVEVQRSTGAERAPSRQESDDPQGKEPKDSQDRIVLPPKEMDAKDVPILCGYADLYTHVPYGTYLTIKPVQPAVGRSIHDVGPQGDRYHHLALMRQVDNDEMPCDPLQMTPHTFLITAEANLPAADGVIRPHRTTRLFQAQADKRLAVTIPSKEFRLIGDSKDEAPQEKLIVLTARQSQRGRPAKKKVEQKPKPAEAKKPATAFKFDKAKLTAYVIYSKDNHRVLRTEFEGGSETPSLLYVVHQNEYPPALVRQINQDGQDKEGKKRPAMLAVKLIKHWKGDPKTLHIDRTFCVDFVYTQNLNRGTAELTFAGHQKNLRTAIEDAIREDFNENHEVKLLEVLGYVQFNDDKQVYELDAPLCIKIVDRSE